MAPAATGYCARAADGSWASHGRQVVQVFHAVKSAVPVQRGKQDELTSGMPHTVPSACTVLERLLVQWRRLKNVPVCAGNGLCLCDCRASVDCRVQHEQGR